MFKKILAILLAVLTVFGTFCMLGCGGNDDEVTSTDDTPEGKIAQSEFLYPDKTEDFRYNKYTHYIKITQCLSLKRNIVIPDTIAGLPVYEIAENAFQDQLTINSVSITDNVFIIGNDAFAGCTNLEEVKLPKGLKTLGTGAFQNSGIKHIEFPNTLLEIPDNVCSNCPQLTYLIINDADVISANEETGETVTTGARTLGGGAISGCPSLKYMWIPEDVTFTDTTVGEVDENMVIYGYSKSPAAQIAADSFVDFKLVQSKAELTEFKNKAELSSDTIALNGDENYKGTLVDIQIEKTFIVREKVKYETSFINEDNKQELVTNSFEYSPVNGTNLVVFGVRVTNNSAQNIKFNQLGSTIKVDTYLSRFISLGTIKNSALARYSKPNYTELKPDETAYMYFAVETDAGWEEININFGNFAELINYNFVIKNDENIIYVGAEGDEKPVEEGDLTTEPVGEKTPSETTTQGTATQPTDTKTGSTSEATTTTAVTSTTKAK